MALSYQEISIALAIILVAAYLAAYLWGRAVGMWGHDREIAHRMLELAAEDDPELRRRRGEGNQAPPRP